MTNQNTRPADTKSSDDQIRLRARELWEERGRPEGYETNSGSRPNGSSTPLEMAVRSAHMVKVPGVGAVRTGLVDRLPACLKVATLIKAGTIKATIGRY